VGPTGVSVRTILGYLAGIVIGTASITLLFLGMRAVMDIGGACADGGPYVTAQPCPNGVPPAMVGGMFGLFGSAGLIVWFGSRIGKAPASIVALGWPALFLTLGFNFLDYAIHPPDGEPTPVWGWLVPGALFWLMGGAPLAIGLLAWREARAGRPGNRLSRQVAAGVQIRPNQVRGGSRPTRDPDATTGPGRTLPPVDRVGFGPSARYEPGLPATPAGDDIDHGRSASATDLAEDLVHLTELHAAGDLTDEEFASATRARLADAEAAR
jgi:hypothetical protein